MEASLNEIRRSLTPATLPGDVRFTSISLKQPHAADKIPTFPTDGVIVVQLGVIPNPPTVVIGRLFDENNGRFVAKLQERTVILSNEELETSFKLPDYYPLAKLCLVIEGRWSDQIAGCEMSIRRRS